MPIVKTQWRQGCTMSEPPCAQDSDHIRVNVLVIGEKFPEMEQLAERLGGEEICVQTFQLLSDVPSFLSLETRLERSAETRDIDCIVFCSGSLTSGKTYVLNELDKMLALQAERPPLIVLTEGNSEKELELIRQIDADDFCALTEGVDVLKIRIRTLLNRQIQNEKHAQILAEFRKQEFELIESRAAEQAAHARAALAAGLEKQNEMLRRTQSQLVQSAKMAALGELVAGLAHEINNPLSYSLAHIQTVAALLGDLKKPEPKTNFSVNSQKLDKAQRRIAEAVNGLDRVAALVVKLRTFSRLDEGEFKKADIKECVEATLPLIRHRLGDKIKVETRYAADNVLFCAPGLINQVILNLLTNAIDAVGSEGEIKIRSSRTKYTYHLCISDTGAGIAVENMDRLFEPFFTTKAVGEGTGLGLAVSYQIIQSHHGDINVINREESGAEFVISLPTNLAELKREKSSHD